MRLRPDGPRLKTTNAREYQAALNAQRGHTAETNWGLRPQPRLKTVDRWEYEAAVERGGLGSGDDDAGADKLYVYGAIGFYEARTGGGRLDVGAFDAYAKEHDPDKKNWRDTIANFIHEESVRIWRHKNGR